MQDYSLIEIPMMCFKQAWFFKTTLFVSLADNFGIQ